MQVMIRRLPVAALRRPSVRRLSTGDDEWNAAWESAWLPSHLSSTTRAPWESDVHFRSPSVVLPSDPDTQAFVAEMDERWDERQRREFKSKEEKGKVEKEKGDYRLRKQRVHAGLWMTEIERMEDRRVSGKDAVGDRDIDRLLDSCAEIFDSNRDNINTEAPNTSEFKTKPDGWETTSKTVDGNIWDVTQREEDILLQEFERRIAFSKFQIASFIKTHIFSRRRPIDGWKYMIEEIGPNARKGKGSVQRLPALADTSTQPFNEEKPAIGSNFRSFNGRQSSRS